MWQFIRSRVLVVIIFLGVAHGLLIVGPKFIRSNHDYMLVISNFNTNLNQVNLLLNVEGQANDGRNTLNITKSVDVRRFSNKMINFKMPEDLVAGSYKITIDGQRGFSFHKEAELVYLAKSYSGLIQLDKPIYKPGDTVKFRMIVLDTTLKPPANLNSLDVVIRDPQGNIIRKWPKALLYAGVFEGDMQIATTPMFGLWNISVRAEGEELVAKTFEVKEYVLSTFGVDVSPTMIPLEEHQGLSLQVLANYYFGKPVSGMAQIELFLDDDKLDQQQTIDVHGVGQVALRFNGDFQVPQDEDHQNVQVRVTFTEQYTNRTVVKNVQIPVFKYPYRMELVKESPQFRPNYEYQCAVKIQYHNGTAAAGITGKVEVFELDISRDETSNSEGLIKLNLNPGDIDEFTVNMYIEENMFNFQERVEKVETITDGYMKLELRSQVKLNNMLKIMVACNDQMAFFVYYVVSKGNIIDAGYVRLNRQRQYLLQVKAMESMIPKAKIIVATVTNRIVSYDSIDIDFQTLRNNFDLTLDENEVKPGNQIELRMSGRPGSYVALAAYDQSLLSYNNNHDVFWEDILQVFNGFHAIEPNEYDKLHSMGLFGRTLDDIMFEGASDKLARDGLSVGDPSVKLTSYRTNFPESWLWQNVTIDYSGKRKMIEVVPDATTSWHLTGFSIHPVYGLGIVKKPIELTTVQPFYIVENLPYSIKRGEVVTLQFTLFNNLGGEYAADVTLFNVANQIEFYERPSEDVSFMKSITVPPNVGVPISFLVKARKLGEMVVRVKAKIMLGLETDALEKVIHVIPESLVQKHTESRIFSYDTYDNASFPINLNINKKADANSTKIKFEVKTNLLTSVVENLENLLAVPTGCGEQNMVKFVPNVVVLDYLTAIGSKQQTVIDKATRLLREGYQNQMRYRQSDGSFGVWANGGGSMFLTAFVAKSMQTASKYISEVDAGMVEKAFEWIANRQHASGRFDEVGSVIHKDMQGGLRNGIALTGYVLIALLENESARIKHAQVIERSQSYLAQSLPGISNAYDMSITTYALLLAGHQDMDKAFDKLLGMSTVLNNGTNDHQRMWNTQWTSVETTAYALLSFVQKKVYPEGIPVMRWLVNQRYVTGSFPRTQDTFVGLKALTKLAEKISPARNAYSIQLKGKKLNKNFRVSSQDINNMQFLEIPSDTRALEIEVGGIGFGLFEVYYEYSLDLQNFAHRFELTLEKLSADYELRMRVCTKFKPMLADEKSNMALVEVNFPSGYVVDKNAISDPTLVNPIKKTEIRFGGTSVVVYYDNMSRELNCFTITAFRRFKVALKRPAFVTVYDYYHSNLNAIQKYEVDD
ncbi:thioester-containing protein 1 allele S3-like [Anopheles nili]|uniref:thioester-containing protein 1 allele S3-like n=1 Tax=Anopheles nili TaxID=185578 RepID=UPI00237AC7F1|nr:thioester-containing protein 1 allele S3-like [Anopheles nili]